MLTLLQLTAFAVVLTVLVWSVIYCLSHVIEGIRQFSQRFFR
jgi:hypothetical protein